MTVEVAAWLGGEAFTGPGRSSIFCFRGGEDFKLDKSGRGESGVGSVEGVVRDRYECNNIGTWCNLEKFGGETNKCC